MATVGVEQKEKWDKFAVDVASILLVNYSDDDLKPLFADKQFRLYMAEASEQGQSPAQFIAGPKGVDYVAALFANAAEHIEEKLSKDAEEKYYGPVGKEIASKRMFETRELAAKQALEEKLLPLVLSGQKITAEQYASVFPLAMQKLEADSYTQDIFKKHQGTSYSMFGAIASNNTPQQAALDKAKELRQQEAVGAKEKADAEAAEKAKADAYEKELHTKMSKEEIGALIKLKGDLITAGSVDDEEKIKEIEKKLAIQDELWKADNERAKLTPVSAEEIQKLKEEEAWTPAYAGRKEDLKEKIALKEALNEPSKVVFAGDSERKYDEMASMYEEMGAETKAEQGKATVLKAWSEQEGAWQVEHAKKKAENAALAELAKQKEAQYEQAKADSAKAIADNKAALDAQYEKTKAENAAKIEAMKKSEETWDKIFTEAAATKKPEPAVAAAASTSLVGKPVVFSRRQEAGNRLVAWNSNEKAQALAKARAYWAAHPGAEKKDKQKTAHLVRNVDKYDPKKNDFPGVDTRRVGIAEGIVKFR